MARIIKNVTLEVIDPTNNFVENKPKKGAQVTYSTPDNKVTVEFSAPSEPADMTTLCGGHPSKIKAKRNNKNGVYSITFNLTGNAILSFGRKALLDHLKKCYESIWEDIN